IVVDGDEHVTAVAHRGLVGVDDPHHVAHGVDVVADPLGCLDGELLLAGRAGGAGLAADVAALDDDESHSESSCGGGRRDGVVGLLRTLDGHGLGMTTTRRFRNVPVPPETRCSSLTL